MGKLLMGMIGNMQFLEQDIRRLVSSVERSILLIEDDYSDFEIATNEYVGSIHASLSTDLSNIKKQLPPEVKT